MSDWSSGYVSELGYTYGYYRELNPSLLSLVCLSKGIRFDANRPLRYLELGFGQGLSLNIHAAAGQGEFWGTDFNPAQAQMAKHLASAAGSQALIHDQSFAEFAARDDLPEFDVIGLHGIWSWISDENRRIIVDIARRKLATGGLLYISYNCMPGWSASLPLRHLMTLHAERSIALDQTLPIRIDSAIDFAQSVVDAGALYFQANPSVAGRLAQLRQQNRNYLAHEYFNRDWLPMPFSDVADLMTTAKLEFAASANLLDHIDQISLTDAGQKLLSTVANPVLKESVRDYLQNTQFRKDLFIKGALHMRPLEQQDRFRAQGFVLTVPPAEVPMKIVGPQGEIALKQEIYQPIIAALAADGHAPKTVAELEARLPGEDLTLALIAQALLILTGAGLVHPVQADAAVKSASQACKALNADLCRRARYSGDITWLASPVTGGGLEVGQVQQLFLLARAQGRATPKMWAEFAWAALAASGERLIKQGKVLDNAEENEAELFAQAKLFESNGLPILTAVGIA